MVRGNYSPSHSQAPHLQHVQGAQAHAAQVQHAQADALAGTRAVFDVADVFMG